MMTANGPIQTGWFLWHMFLNSALCTTPELGAVHGVIRMPIDWIGDVVPRTTHGKNDAMLGLIDADTTPGSFVWFHPLLPHSPFVFDAEGRLHGRPHNKIPPGYKVEEIDTEALMRNYRD